MRRTKHQLDFHRIRMSRVFNELENELLINKKRMRTFREMLYSYEKEHNKIRICMMNVIREFRNVMNKQDWEILKMRVRVSNRLKLSEIGEKYGITRERVRQRESRGLWIIRDYWKGKY